MRRRELLQGFVAALSGLFISKAKATPAERVYAFKDIFTNRVFPNPNLFYLRESPFKQKLFTQINHLIERHGRYYYIGEYDITLPVKKAYTESELLEFFLLIRHRILTRYGSLHLPPNTKDEPINFIRTPRHLKQPIVLTLNLTGYFKTDQ